MLIWGIHPIENCLRLRPGLIQKLYLGPNFAHAPIQQLLKQHHLKPELVNKHEFERLTNHQSHQGVAADINLPAAHDLNSFLKVVQTGKHHPLLVMIDGVVDPQNFGAILRSAYLLGASGVILRIRRQAKLTSAVINVSTGYALTIPLLWVANLGICLDRLQKNGFWVYATALAGKSQNFYQVKFDHPVVLIVGNEGQGIHSRLLHLADSNLKIPLIDDKSSLNVAAATAILIAQIKHSQQQFPIK